MPYYLHTNEPIFFEYLIDPPPSPPVADAPVPSPVGAFGRLTEKRDLHVEYMSKELPFIDYNRVLEYDLENGIARLVRPVEYSPFYKMIMMYYAFGENESIRYLEVLRQFPVFFDYIFREYNDRNLYNVELIREHFFEM